MGLTFIPRPSEARWKRGHPCGIGLTERVIALLVEIIFSPPIQPPFHVMECISGTQGHTNKRHNIPMWPKPPGIDGMTQKTLNGIKFRTMQEESETKLP